MKTRRMFCLILAVLLVFPAVSSFAETSWANASLPKERYPEYIEIVPWDELPPANPDQHHYLLLVIDQKNISARPDDAYNPSERAGQHKDDWGNTDGIVILTLDTRAKRIMLTSIIRDAIIAKPNSTETQQKHGRINYVYNDYGPEALCQVISEHLGFRIEKYIMFTFFQVRDIIEDMGGVDVELTRSEINYLRDGYVINKGQAVSLDGKWDVRANKNAPEGVYHLKSWAAVLLMRIRKDNSEGDLLRTGRARKVLSALADKCRTLTLDQAIDLVNNLSSHANKTNLSAEDLVQAAQYAWSLRDQVIEERRVPEDDDVRPITFANMAAKEINWTAAREKILDYLHYNYLVMDDDDD